MGENVLEGTAENFDALIAVPGPVLVDFWAPWCGPCKVLSPAVERLARETAGLTVVKVDVQAHPALGARFEVRSIPMLLVFQGGEVVDRKLGATGGYGGLKDLVAPHVTPATS